MVLFLHKQLEELKKRLLTLGSLVEDRVYKACRAVRDMDGNLAGDVANSDEEIDAMEIRVEEECLKIIALYQPVATDLRFLVCTIKINNDLERIADLAVSISIRVLTMVSAGIEKSLHDYDPMAEKTVHMLQKSLDAFVRLDEHLAEEVLAMDDEVDAMKNEVYEKVLGLLHGSKWPGEMLLNTFLISRHLERIADHATNIAEEVIYMARGEIVRHRDD